MAHPKSLRFFTGDEQGRVKSVICTKNEGKWAAVARTLEIPDVGSSAGVQKMSFLRQDDGDLLAVARTDGNISLLRDSSPESAETSLSSILEMAEGRLRKPAHFVGLALRETGIYTCTSSGHLRLTPLPSPSSSDFSELPQPKLGNLPTRLRELRLSPSGKTLAYGGDEVNLSVWDVERAFAGPSSASAPSEAAAIGEGGKKKRKKETLFPGELWRARNEPNDALDLRPPIQITALAYRSEQVILTGNEDSTVKVYDTRAGGRRPVAYWKGVLKGPVRVVENGYAENQVFVGDAAGTLAAIDARTGRCSYTYKGLTSALTSLAPIPLPSSSSSSASAEPPLLASVGRDRLFRLSTAPPPPENPKTNQHHRGEVLLTEYLPSVPAAVVFAGWGGVNPGSKGPGQEGEGGEDDGDGAEEAGEEVWEGMEEVGSDKERERKKRRVRT